jgi:hypothetical protein
MLLPDGSVLMHGSTPYDPAKAHEYYLRYRKLHPRAPGSKAPTGTFAVRDGTKLDRMSGAQLEEQKVYAAERVAAIKKRLTDLNTELKAKIKAAAESERKAKEKPTAHDKLKAAQAAKDYRAKHKTAIAAKAKAKAATSPSPPKKKTETVDSLKKEIITAKSDLKAAVAKQRNLAAATKNG